MKKFLSTILCFVIIVSCFAGISVNAAVTYPLMAEISSNSGKAAIYSLPGTTGHETPENKNKSQWLCDLANGTQVIAWGVELDGDGDKWYKINYGQNFENTGYAFINRVNLKYEFPFDEDFEKNLKYFPESYHSALRALHSKYPNWRFVANQLDLTFKEAVEAQYGVDDVKNTRKWVEFTYGDNEWRDMRAYDSTTEKWITLESRWTYASREAIEYYMDPRNSLNEDMIFAFMQQSYVEDAKTQDNLRAVIKGTFLEKGYDKNGDGTPEKDAYIEDLIAAAKESRVSAYVLAATIIVEQGIKGESSLISGVYLGYENCYNFFNFSAAGSTEKEIVENGLKFAKDNGWNSRTAAIIGGAKKYADGYISIGQDTYYYKDFNVIKEVWNHQYASALYDAWTNAAYLKKGCITNTNTVLTFSIPVFADMPSIVCPNPSYMIDIEVKDDCIVISPKKSGVYTFGSINNEITVFDNSQNDVKYNQTKQGWPLVAGQEYTLKIKDYNGDYLSVTLNVKKTFDTIFPDTYAGEWYNNAITYVVGRGIMTGYGSNGYFGTADSIQRQDFLVMLARYDGADLSKYQNRNNIFPDIPNGSYYEAAVMWGYEKGIVSGYQNGKFGVGDKITREQLVTFLYRYAGYKGLNTSCTTTQKNKVKNTYTDYKKVTDYAQDPVIWAVTNSVINGKTPTTIVPGGNALRCEVAQIMYNIFNNAIF